MRVGRGGGLGRGLSLGLGLGVALGTLACEDSASKAAVAPASRVVAVAAKSEEDASDFCDVLAPAASAPRFTYPPLDTKAPKPSGRWRWVNVWASWCAPCAEELPLITRFQAQLLARGKPVDVVYLSVDSSPEAAAEFAKSHTEVQGSLRLSDFNALQRWLTSVGLDAGATLPVHLFIDPEGKVRCARTGALRDTDLRHLELLLPG